MRIIDNAAPVAASELTFMQPAGNVSFDFDGDGKADLAVWRPTTGVWHLYLSATSAYQTYILGAPDDTAVPSAYLKQIGGLVYIYDFAQIRLSPKNAAGASRLILSCDAARDSAASVCV